MNQNPPPTDFVKMQEQAIRRVREMQQKASPSGQSGIKEGPPIERAEKAAAKPESATKTPNETKTEAPEAKRVQKEEKPKAEPGMGLFSGLLNIDADMSIILPLLLFLGKDGADDVLILALLYIMS